MWADGAGFTEATDFQQVADRLTGPARKKDDGYLAEPQMSIFAHELFSSYRDVSALNARLHSRELITSRTQPMREITSSLYWS